MAVEPAVFVPPIAVAHVLGFLLLLYSLEKVSGVVSKTFRWRRRSSPVDNPSPKAQPRTGSDDSPQDDLSTAQAPKDGEEPMGAPEEPHGDWDSSLEARAMMHTAAEPHMLTAPWVRGCACQARCLHAASQHHAAPHACVLGLTCNQGGTSMHDIVDSDAGRLHARQPMGDPQPGGRARRGERGRAQDSTGRRR
jgi:hypothetical protein